MKLFIGIGLILLGLNLLLPGATLAAQVIGGIFSIAGLLLLILTAISEEF